mgnify:FL=1
MKVLVSGGFDPLHVGHVRLIADAARYGEVVVALNSDAWLKRKKGYVFMHFQDRNEILKALLAVDRVIAVDDDDGTVCAALTAVRPRYFANGGDRVSADAREHALCRELGIVELFGVGGGKVRSSSEMIRGVRL